MPSYFSDRINSPHDVSPISDRTKVCQPRRRPKYPDDRHGVSPEVTTMTCADPRTARTLSTSIGLTRTVMTASPPKPDSTMATTVALSATVLGGVTPSSSTAHRSTDAPIVIVDGGNTPIGTEICTRDSEDGSSNRGVMISPTPMSKPTTRPIASVIESP